jgi:cellulose synthase/poly-beta-1,6-N-acetylglucosamine synthase-like glycosyltransferase
LIAIWVLIAITGLLYLLMVGFIFFGWIRTQTFIIQDIVEQPSLSVIIPVRNESSQLSDLLFDLNKQDYPADKFEVIIVDDHSDRSPESIITEFRGKTNIRLLHLGKDECGKKAAMMKGLLASDFEIIMTTDADCRIQKSWISEMVNFFVSKKVKLVFGSVQFTKSIKLFDWFQSLEFVSLVASGAGFAGNRHPIFCNAANMGFERKTYLQFLQEKGSDLPVSGDDVLFLLWLKKKYPDKIGFIKSLNAQVETKPAGSIKDFIYQRLRWTSKSRYYRDLMIIVTSLIVYITSLSLLILLVGSFFSKLLATGFICLFILKCITDLFFLFIITGYYRNRYLLAVFLPLEIIHFIYISIIGFAGNLFEFTWKGRKSRS